MLSFSGRTVAFGVVLAMGAMAGTALARGNRHGQGHGRGGHDGPGRHDRCDRDNEPLSSAEARDIITSYYLAVRGLDVDEYVSHFGENASMEDPVGAGAVRGLDAVAATYQVAVSSFTVLDMREQDVFTPDGTNEAAVRWTATLTLYDGVTVLGPFNGITTFKFNNDGSIRELRAFWDPSVIGF